VKPGVSCGRRHGARSPAEPEALSFQQRSILLQQDLSAEGKPAPERLLVAISQADAALTKPC